ncbi:MAG: hypothetical protein ACYSXF_06845, partial [Planctomycetota bacterium]
AESLNDRCPMTGKPIDGRNYVTYKTQKIGFCCGSCPKRFEAWSQQRKDEFVEAALAKGSEPAPPPMTAPARAELKGDVYTLATCPVSGEKLGTMGDPVVREYEGREVRFCCSGCIGKFEADQKTYFKKIDKALVKQQLPYYPLDVCLLSGEALVEGGEDVGVSHIYGNRLVRFCCKMCAREFEKDPVDHLKKLDEAIIKKQRKAYPLATCMVGGGELGSMGEPAEIIAGTRLVRFCCAGCIRGFKKNPSKYLATLDEAWKGRHKSVKD